MEAAVADDPKKNGANKEFKKARQAEDGKRAMTEYENSAIASRAKTARLRALRLGRGARAAPAAPGPAPPAAGGGGEGVLQRGGVGRIGFREHAVDLVGPAAIVLDDLVGDFDHGTPRVQGRCLPLRYGKAGRLHRPGVAA